MEQTLYVRILTLVDDYGRYEADPELIRSEGFPYGDPNGDPVPVPTVDSSLLSLVSKDLMVLYEFEGKRYLQLTRWKERVRSESRYPDPKNGTLLTFDSKCQQMFASTPQPSPQPTPTPGARICKQTPDLFELTSKVKTKVSELYKRGNSPWVYSEEHALAEVCRRPDALKEFDQILAWRLRMNGNDRKFFPQSVEKLLNGWTASLDKSRTQSSTPKTTGNF